MFTVGLIRFCRQTYQNWLEVAMATAREKDPAKVIFKNGTRKDDIVVDIGAHSGVFTVFAASKTQKAVYAFEPFLNNFEVLKRNVLTTNGLNNVIAHWAAVADKVGSAALLICPKTGQGHVLADRFCLLEESLLIPSFSKRKK